MLSVQDAAPQFIEFEAAAAQIEDESGRVEIAKRAENRDAHEPRFFLAGNDFQLDFGLVANALN